MTTIDETVSKAFRTAFESHPARVTDPALALTSAREDASALVPAGVTGTFDDEALTFVADSTNRYEVRPIRDADCTMTSETISSHDDLTEARDAAAHYTGVYGCAIVDTKTGLTDWGRGFGVAVEAD